jgi:hypothetical protein
VQLEDGIKLHQEGKGKCSWEDWESAAGGMGQNFSRKGRESAAGRIGKVQQEGWAKISAGRVGKVQLGGLGKCSRRDGTKFQQEG